jgi:vitamin B12 transporter
MHARPPQPARSNVLRAAFPATLCAALVAIAPVAARAQSAETLALSRTAADDEVAATMPGIVVTATRSPEPAADLVADVTVLEGDLSRRAPALPQLLRFTGGVQTTVHGGPAGTSGVLIRGGSTGHTLTLIEGFRISSASLGHTTFEGLPIAHADRIEVLRGPASALYGADALAGVVQLFAPTAAPGLRTDAEAAIGQESTRRVAAGLGGGSDRITAGVRVSRDRSDGFNATKPGNFAYNPDRDGYDREAVSAHLDARVGSATRLRAIALHGRLRADFDDGDFAGARTDQRTELVGLVGSHALDDDTEVGLRLGQSTDRSDTRSAFPGEFRSRQLQYGVQAARRLAPGHRLQLFLERLEEKVTSSAYGLARPPRRGTDSAGLAYLGSIGRHRLQASLRNDDSDQYGGQASYTLAYGYRLAGGLLAGVSHATGFHAPGFNDLYFPNYGRPTIRPERSRSSEAGLYWHASGAGDAHDAERGRRRGDALAGGWHAKAVLFESRVRDLIAFAASCPDPDPRFSFGCADNVDRARIRGASLLLGNDRLVRRDDGSETATGLAWHVGVDFLDPRDVATGRLLARRSRRQLTAGIAWGLGDFTLGADLLAASGRYDDAANLRPLGGYAIASLRAAWRLARGWQAFATIENIGDRDYATAADYAQQGRLALVGVRYQAGS